MASKREVAILIKAVDRASKVIKGVSESASRAMRSIAKGAAIATAAFAAVVGTAIKAFADFEQSMALVSTLIQDNWEETTDALGGSIRLLSTELPQSLGSLTNAMYQLLSASVPVGKSMMALEVSAKAAVGGVTDTSTAVGLLTGVINGMNLSFDDFNEVADLAFSTVNFGVITFGELSGSIGRAIPAANKLKASTGELFGSMAFLTKNALSAEMAATALGATYEALAKKSTELSEKFGVQVFGEMGEFRGILEVMTDISDVLDGLNQQAKTKILEEMGFERQASRAIIAMTLNLEGFQTTMGNVIDSAGAAQDAFDKMKNTMINQLRVLRNNITNLAIVIGDRFSEAAALAIRKVQEMVRVITRDVEDNGLDKIADNIENFIKSIDAAKVEETAAKIVEVTTALGHLFVVVVKLTAANWKLIASFAAFVILAKVATWIAAIIPLIVSITGHIDLLILRVRILALGIGTATTLGLGAGLIILAGLFIKLATSLDKARKAQQNYQDQLDRLRGLVKIFTFADLVAGNEEALRVLRDLRMQISDMTKRIERAKQVVERFGDSSLPKWMQSLSSTSGRIQQFKNELETLPPILLELQDALAELTIPPAISPAVAPRISVPMPLPGLQLAIDTMLLSYLQMIEIRKKAFSDGIRHLRELISEHFRTAKIRIALEKEIAAQTIAIQKQEAEILSTLADSAVQQRIELLRSEDKIREADSVAAQVQAHSMFKNIVAMAEQAMKTKIELAKNEFKLLKAEGASLLAAIDAKAAQEIAIEKEKAETIAQAALAIQQWLSIQLGIIDDVDAARKAEKDAKDLAKAQKLAEELAAIIGDTQRRTSALIIEATMLTTQTQDQIREEAFQAEQERIRRMGDGYVEFTRTAISALRIMNGEEEGRGLRALAMLVRFIAQALANSLRERAFIKLKEAAEKRATASALLGLGAQLLAEAALKTAIAARLAIMGDLVRAGALMAAAGRDVLAAAGLAGQAGLLEGQAAALNTEAAALQTAAVAVEIAGEAASAGLENAADQAAAAAREQEAAAAEQEAALEEEIRLREEIVGLQIQSAGLQMLANQQAAGFTGGSTVNAPSPIVPSGDFFATQPVIVVNQDNQFNGFLDSASQEQLMELVRKLRPYNDELDDLEGTA